MERKPKNVNTIPGKKNTKIKNQQVNKTKNLKEANDIEDMIFWSRVFLHILAAIVVILILVFGISYINS